MRMPNIAPAVSAARWNPKAIPRVSGGTESHLVLVDSTQNSSWHWNANSNTTQKLENSSLTNRALESTYSFFEMNNQSALSLNLNPASHVLKQDRELLFQLGVHEFFHYTGQKGWKGLDASGSRGTVYPAEWQPRFYRRMIFSNLMASFQIDDAQYLRNAKFWYEKWAREYPEEVKSTADGYEGTAEYVGRMASIVAKAGCTASESELRRLAASELRDSFGGSVSASHFALDNEGYEIGGLATFILRFQNGGLTAAVSRMANGETPLQILLENESAQVQGEEPFTRTMFIDAQKKYNAEVGAVLDQDIANWNSPLFIRVPTPFSWLRSNLVPQFFAFSKVLNLELFPLAIDHSFESSDNRSSFTIRKDAIIFQAPTPICPNLYEYTLVPSSQIQINEGQIKILSPKVEGVIQGRVSTDAQGFSYICADIL